MSDIHALSGAYAVDALDDIERAQFERHLAVCPECTAEVNSFHETAALLAETTASAPSAELRERVLAGISAVRPLPPTAPEEVETLTSTQPRRRRRVVSLLVAAAAAIAIGTGGVVWQQLADDDSTSQTEQVLTASDAQRFTVDFDGGATATLVRSKALNKAVLVTEDMPAPPDGRAYALWLQHDDVMVPAGIMPPGPDNEVLLSGDAASANGAGITVESADREPTEPSDDVVALFSFDA